MSTLRYIAALYRESQPWPQAAEPHVVRPWTEMERQRMEEGQLDPWVFVKDEVGTEGQRRRVLHTEVYNYLDLQN